MDVEHRLPNLTNTLQIIGCHLGTKPAGWSYARHHHFLFELIQCKKGEVRQTVGDDTLLLRTGDWLLIKSGVPHDTDNRSNFPYVFFNLHFDVDDPIIRSKLCESDYLFIRSDDPIGSTLAVHLEKIEQAFQNQMLPGSDECEAAIGRLLVQSHTLGLVSAFAGRSVELSEHQAAKAQQTIVSTAFETETAHAIEEKLRSGHYGSIAEIAESLGLSRGRCTQLFTKVYGQAPRQYVSRLVLNRAKHLLVHSTHTMEELAEQLGFQSASHFSRQFRRWTGMPPSAFRPRHSTSPKKPH